MTNRFIQILQAQIERFYSSKAEISFHTGTDLFSTLKVSYYENQFTFSYKIQNHNS